MKKRWALMLLVPVSLVVWALKDSARSPPILWSTDLSWPSEEEAEGQYRDPSVRFFRGEPTYRVDPRYPDISKIVAGAPKGLAYAVGTRGLEAVHVEGVQRQRSEVCREPNIFFPHRGKHLLFFSAPPTQYVRLWSADELFLPPGRAGKALKAWLKERGIARIYSAGSKPLFGLISDYNFWDPERLDGMLFWPDGALDLFSFSSGDLRGLRKGLRANASVEGLFALSDALYLILEVEEASGQGLDCCCALGTFLVRLDGSGPRVVRAP